MGWDDDHDPPRAGAKAGTAAAPRRPAARTEAIGLRHLMILVAGCAVLVYLGRGFARTGDFADLLALGLGIGVAVAALGAWIAVRSRGSVSWGWVLMVVGYLIGSGVLLHVMALVTLPVPIAVLVVILLRRRAAERQALVGVLAIAAGRGMPLEPGVEAFAEQTSGAPRRWARSMATLLAQGYPLPDAVDALPETVSRQAAVLIRAGAGVGMLGPALREAASAAVPPAALRGVMNRIGYLLWVLLMGQAVVAFLGYFIAPKFEAIFRDFGIALPWITRAMIDAAGPMALAGVVLGALEMILLAVALAELVGRGGLGVASPSAWLNRRRDAALVLRALALPVEAGRPIGPTLDMLAGTFPNPLLRRRLRTAAGDHLEGVPWADALRDARVISRGEAGVLDAAGRAGNLAWALRTMADLGERRWAYRLQAWSQAGFVAALLGAGGVVLLIALAYFAPLIELISKLAP